MPTHNARYVRARLADPSHILPWNGRLFGQGGEEAGVEYVDLWSPFTQLLLADGSIVSAGERAVKTEDEPETQPAS